jgi:hypothetical protein
LIYQFIPAEFVDAGYDLFLPEGELVLQGSGAKRDKNGGVVKKYLGGVFGNELAHNVFPAILNAELRDLDIQFLLLEELADGIAQFDEI